MPLTPAVWLFIFLGAASLLWPRRAVLSLTLLGTGYLLALITGLVEWPFVIPLALLLVAAYAVAPQRTRPSRIAGHILFVAVGLPLGFHLLPGFNNPQPFGPAPLTPDAVPFTFYLNLDKPLLGYWVLLTWPALRLRRGARSWAYGVAIGLGTAIICLGLGVAMGKLAFAPKWPGFIWLWALNSVLLVSLTEEALFRGYFQEALSRRFAEHRHGELFAIGIAAVLFGAVHVMGGLAYVLVTGLAGVGYGLAYRKGGLEAAVMAHVTVSLLHFTLLTYPLLA
jgi:membrane protease YdiL (CAAX protease family)